MNLINKGLIEKADLLNKWVKVEIPRTGAIDIHDIFRLYGRLIKLTDSKILLFSDKYGLKQVPISDIVTIRKAKVPWEEKE